MDWASGRRGCATLLLIAAILIGVLAYFTWDSRDETPSRSQGYLPPQQPVQGNRG